MNERYKNMMNEVEMSRELRASIEEKLAEPRRSRRPLRTALVAACLALALVGGAFAADYLGRVEPVGLQSGVEHSGYDLSLDMSREEAMSEAIKNDLAAGTLQPSFDDKAALEEYLGFELIDNDKLDSAGIIETLEEAFYYGFDLYPELEAYPDARYVLTGTAYDGTPMDTDPEVLKITSHRVVDNYEVYVTARVLTGSTEGDIVLSGEDFEPEMNIYHKRIIDEDGNTSFEPEFYWTAVKEFSYETYTTPGGLEVTIVTAETENRNQDEAREAGIPVIGHGFRDYIAYFVCDGVLYSIKPYAIYDPVVSNGHDNGYELIILKRILREI